MEPINTARVANAVYYAQRRKPTRCHCMLYYTYETLNMFRALLCPSSGARDYMYLYAYATMHGQTHIRFKCRVLFQNGINLIYCASCWFYYRNISRCTVLQTSSLWRVSIIRCSCHFAVIFVFGRETVPSVEWSASGSSASA